MWIRESVAARLLVLTVLPWECNTADVLTYFVTSVRLSRLCARRCKAWLATYFSGAARVLERPRVEGRGVGIVTAYTYGLMLIPRCHDANMSHHACAGEAPAALAFFLPSQRKKALAMSVCCVGASGGESGEGCGPFSETLVGFRLPHG